MQTRREGAFWANDDITAVPTAGGDGANAAGRDRSGSTSSTDSEDYQELEADDGTGAGSGSDASDSETSDAAPKKKQSDLDYLKSKMKVGSLSDTDDDDEEHAAGSDDANQDSGSSSSDSDSDSSSSDSSDDSDSDDDAAVDGGVSEHGRLFVRNLAFATSDSDLRDVFAKYVTSGVDVRGVGCACMCTRVCVQQMRVSPVCLLTPNVGLGFFFFSFVVLCWCDVMLLCVPVLCCVGSEMSPRRWWCEMMWAAAKGLGLCSS